MAGGALEEGAVRQCVRVRGLPHRQHSPYHRCTLHHAVQVPYTVWSKKS